MCQFSDAWLMRSLSVAVLLWVGSGSGATFAENIIDCPPDKKPHCVGNVRIPHPEPGYDFVTTSRTYPKARIEVYETCVENHSDRLMEFNWFIPGSHGWVPPFCAVSNPRYKERDTITGFFCLKNDFVTW
jgi:hypothetical protein